MDKETIKLLRGVLATERVLLANQERMVYAFSKLDTPPRMKKK